MTIGTQNDAPPAGDAPPPADSGDWRSALGSFAGNRIALARFEAREAAGVAVRRVLLVAIAAFCALFAWGLFVLGGIGLLTRVAGWPWFGSALAGAGLHLAVALVCLALVKRAAPEAFRHTKEQLQKDSEWLANLQKNRKS